MIRDRLKELGGRTLNTSLSPDQSIAHGATYYAGMLMTNTEFAKSIHNKEVSSRLARMKQVSVNARGLGILVQNEQKIRVPHYLIPPNTPHKAVAVGGPARVLDVFSPIREDYAELYNKYIPESDAS